MTSVAAVEIVDTAPRWRDGLAGLAGHDFAHTFDFHGISMARGEGYAMAFIARDGKGHPLAMWPVLKRMIPSSDAFDFTSVYGYAGPLLGPEVDGDEPLAAIWAEMARYGAVSLFSRMHPLFADRLAEPYCGERLSDVVIIDVTSNPNPPAGYRGSHRREIINSRAKGVTVVQREGPEAVNAFYDIYRAAMVELGARDYYLFDVEYIHEMASAIDFGTIMLFAELNGKKIAASVFLITGNIMQYYLSGTISEFRHLSPSKAIIAEAHQMAQALGIKKIALGGGVGSSADPLFAFKKGFSPITKPFYVTRKVLNERRYRELCAWRGVAPRQDGFFPAYRDQA